LLGGELFEHSLHIAAFLGSSQVGWSLSVSVAQGSVSSGIQQQPNDIGVYFLGGTVQSGARPRILVDRGASDNQHAHHFGGTMESGGVQRSMF
jgi:hypothetical protein